MAAPLLLNDGSGVTVLEDPVQIGEKLSNPTIAADAESAIAAMPPQPIRVRSNMTTKLRLRLRDQRGFTLIELLVVILIIGILAAIAIPSFLNQKGKANDASAKELARTAQTTAESYATENNGGYANLSPTVLNGLEKTIPIASSANAAWISAASGSSTGYVVTATAPSTGDTFTITNASGVVTRTCSGTGGGCKGSAGW
jgi:type IV pilus assembly protein PilA